MNANRSDHDTQAVLEILSRELGIDRDQLRGEARIQEDLGADSLTIIEITMAIEEQLHVTIPDERLEAIRTVDDMLNALKEARQLAQPDTCNLCGEAATRFRHRQ